VVVGVTSLTSAVIAHRAGNVKLARGVSFGLVAIGGAAAGATASSLVSEPVLLACFAALMLLVAAMIIVRQVRHARGGRQTGSTAIARPKIDDPIISLRGGFGCDCPRAVKVLVTATAVGLLTGFLGVGGGFLVVPALTLALALPMQYAAGTSLVVITLTSAAALAVRAGVGTTPNWGLVAALTAASVIGGVAGARLADRTDSAKLAAAFTGLMLAVAVYTAARALPALL
jgi:uncharacterized membrane protein YfcA